jgi:cell division protease FtsH
MGERRGASTGPASRPGPSWPPGRPPRGPILARLAVGYVLAAWAALLLVQAVFFSRPAEAPLAGAGRSLVEMARRGEVVSAEISDTSVTWRTRDGRRFVSTLPPNYETAALVDDLAGEGVAVSGRQPNPLATLFWQWVLPLALIGALWVVIGRRLLRGPAGALELGRHRAKIYDRREMRTTFADVAGVDEAVEELREIVDFLRHPARYQRLGGRIPKGVLLLGPPGCGKTLLARAVAGEAGVPFFYISGSDFVELFVGLGAARVRDLFQQAKERAPCLVFIDEIDTIGRSRAGAVAGSVGAHDEREQTLNQLLVEMDGFDSSRGVIIMAATNRPEILDPALVRPGRFDRQIVVDRPDIRGREAILRVHARGVPLAPDVDLRAVAALTPGFTGADLANVVNEAALLAARRDRAAVGMQELQEAVDRVLAGPERRSRVLSPAERRRVAVHEMGHALVALRSPHADPVHRVSIIPRGAAALGMTMQRPLEDRFLLTRPELEDRLAVLLGGRAAEEVVFGSTSTGAQDDLRRATDVARAMVVEYGMSERLGPVAFGPDGFRAADGRPLLPWERPPVSERTAETVDEEVGRLVEEARHRTRAVLEAERDLLERLAALLLEREVLEGEELRELAGAARPADAA